MTGRIRRALDRAATALPRRSGKGRADATLESAGLMATAARAREALAPVAPHSEFTDRLAAELKRVASTAHARERVGAVVGEIGLRPQRFTRAWVRRYRWAIGVTGSAAFAVIGAVAVAVAWRLRNA